MPIFEAIIVLIAIVASLAFIGALALTHGVDSRPSEPVRWV
jgi:hypothetical protein